MTWMGWMLTYGRSTLLLAAVLVQQTTSTSIKGLEGLDHGTCLQGLEATVEIEVDGQRHVFAPTWQKPIAEATAFCGALHVYQSNCPALVAQQAQAKLSDVHALASYLNCRGFDTFEGHTSLFPVSVQILSSLIADSAIRRALQIGFNAGHSTMTLLRANPNVHITSFDLAEHPYVLKQQRSWT
ncbi:hypothetical protein H310_14869 [Aphanomyces invadans]|uniref:O-methyltransferase domain-containing protein n=1 Tax=Aphanomyces invadans TaxID=157072 RepID=A0A024T9N6_9STRA|nr:hypothetical protein H310_14869 [Aphanomyces invadans]ETV90326.1 hypothetical protein H310_14869 [Aphanomyces invadans]|eukprot:XP_008881053.1 hypothetical protein H310_14869 [Aphanomyces invadans]